MKKIVIPCLILLLIIPLVTSVEFSIKPEYKRGETLITSISGNFLDSIQKENVKFYRNHIEVPFIYDVKSINDDYYIYVELSDTQVQPLANYSIVISGVRYYQGSQIVSDEIRKNFSISKKEKTLQRFIQFARREDNSWRNNKRS